MENREWKTYLLSDISSKIGDGLHGTPKYDGNGDYYFINGNNLTNGSIVFKEDTKTVTEEEFLKYRKDLNDNSVLISINGTIGNLSFYRNEKVVLGKSAAYVNLLDTVDKKFVYYNFKSKFFQNYLVDIATGTTIPNVPLKGLREYEIQLPPLPEQKAIASVLSSLDDKIELLHQQNQTLEALAETLFRQWFIEEAKEDWEEGKLGDLIVVKYGKDHKKLLDGNIPVYGSGGLMRRAEKSLYDGESVLIPRKGSLNNVMYKDEQFWTVDTMFYTEMKISNVAKFVYYFLKSQDLASMNVGSAVPSMTTDILNNMPIITPPSVVLEKFEDTVTPLFVKIKSNQEQIQTLTQLRNTLLAKLMSGEVRVKKISIEYE